MDNFGELARIDIFQAFVASLELFKSFQGGLGHAAVGFLGAADENELIALGEALVAVVVIQAEPKQAGDFGRGFAGGGCRFFAHGDNVLASAGVSSGFSILRGASSSRTSQMMSVNASS